MIKTTSRLLITHKTFSPALWRCSWRRRLAVLFVAALVFSSLVFSSAVAQQCLNYLSVDDTRVSEPAACYFLRYGDTSNAFAEVTLLADALDFAWQESSSELTLERYGVQAVLESTRDVTAGLSKRPDALRVADGNLTSPAAIYADERYYLPVAPVVRALGGDAYWRSDTRTIYITMPTAAANTTSADAISADVTSTNTNVISTPKTFAPLEETSAETSIAKAPAETSITANTGTRNTETLNTGTLPIPRVGIHDDYTRIALDLPAGSRYSLAVAGSRTLLVTFAEGLGAPPQAGARVGSEQVSAWQFRSLENQLALVIEAEHPLRASGQGFQVGFLPRGEGRAQDVLYIDLSAERQGPTVAQRSLDDLAPLSALSTTPDTDTATAAPTRAPAIRPRQTVTRTVVIDPGHGGYDPGAQGYVSEEVVVLDIALRLRDALEAQGINVILSRDDDYHLDERKATDLAARAAMATTDRNLFVSIHANAAESSAANGIETWVFGEPLEEDLIQNAITENGGGSIGLELTEEAKRVHDSVLNDIFRQEQLHYSMTLAEAVQNAMVTATGARDRGIRKNYFYVIRNARIPAVLVEVGFVSNPDEGRKLGRADYRARIADSIAEGIVAFFEQEGALVSR